MIQLNAAQAKMREDFLQRYVSIKKEAADTSEFCYLCDKPGDNRQVGSMFSTTIPSIHAGHPERGLIMDSIVGIWVCAQCVKELEGKN